MRDKSGYKLSEHIFARTLILAALALVALITVCSVSLGIYTRHGQEIETPDFTGMTYAQARSLADESGLFVEIRDSAYVRNMRKGLVFSQTPKAGSMVKKDRRIRLSVNATRAKKVKMPSVTGLSLRQAKAELASRGLVLGRISYVSDIATNNVLSQLYKGSGIEAGKMIESGSRIDLVLGVSPAEEFTYVPSVTGRNCSRATDIIHENSFNVGRTIYDRSVRNYSDSVNAVVYRQNPTANKIPRPRGESITLYLTVDTTKLH